MRCTIYKYRHVELEAANNNDAAEIKLPYSIPARIIVEIGANIQQRATADSETDIKVLPSASERAGRDTEIIARNSGPSSPDVEDRDKEIKTSKHLAVCIEMDSKHRPRYYSSIISE